MKNRVIQIAFVIAIVALGSACSDGQDENVGDELQDAAEEAGENVEDAAEEVGDEAEDATN